MGLNKEEKNAVYLAGRYAAIVEICNERKLSAAQFGNIQRQPGIYLPMYDAHPEKMSEERMEILSLLDSDSFPKKVESLEEQGKIYIGYYHQLSAITPVLEKI